MLLFYFMQNVGHGHNINKPQFGEKRKEGEKLMISVSELAAGKLQDIIAKQKNPQATMLRISFGGYG